MLNFNPRTYKQSHTPTLVQKGGGGGRERVDGPSWVFIVLQYFEKISPLLESLGCAPAAGACDAIKEIVKKR